MPRQKRLNIPGTIFHVIGREIEQGDLYRKGRGNGIAKAKGLLSYWSVEQLGVSRKAVAQRLGVSQQAISLSIQVGRRYSKENFINLIS